MSAARNPAAVEDEYFGEHHVYEAHRTGLPPMGAYFREFWRRKSFAYELARSNMRAANTDTVFGQLWLVLNPLLLAGVYFLMINVIRGDGTRANFFPLLTSGLFLYYYITGCLQQGATSVTAGGRLVLNTPFPKMLLPLATMYTAFRRYLPTLVVYAVIHLVSRQPIGWALLWMPVIILLASIMGLGLASLFATLQVYFRDTASFLPYFIRIWLYLSPVLWTIEQARAGGGKYQLLVTWSWINPLYGLLGAQGEVLTEGISPSPDLLLHGAAWALALLVLGSLVLMSREREFAVRL